MLRVGQEAPDFELPGAAGDDIDRHALTEYTDNGWWVILMFYPFDFHPACVSQWCSLRDADWLTLESGVAVLGVGGDSVYSHKEFGRHHDVQFPLLADTGGQVSEAYGVLRDRFDQHDEVPSRALFVIDPGRQVQYAWQAASPDEQPDIDAVRKATNCKGDECVVLDGKDLEW